jgi:hypothetical protein
MSTTAKPTFEEFKETNKPKVTKKYIGARIRQRDGARQAPRRGRERTRKLDVSASDRDPTSQILLRIAIRAPRS